MTKVQTSVLIGAPVETVYAFASDWRNYTSYFDYVKEVRPITEKTIGEGAQLELKVKFRGLPLKAEWRGVDDTPNAGWSFDAKLMGRWAKKRWLLEPVDGSTRVMFSLEYEPPSPQFLGRLLDALLIRPEWERLYKRAFETLKQLMETEAATNIESAPATE